MSDMGSGAIAKQSLSGYSDSISINKDAQSVSILQNKQNYPKHAGIMMHSNGVNGNVESGGNTVSDARSTCDGNHVHAFQTSVSKGDTLYDILLRTQISENVAFRITKVINKLYRLSTLQANDKIYIALVKNSINTDNGCTTHNKKAILHFINYDDKYACNHRESIVSHINVLINDKLFKLTLDPAKKLYTVVLGRGDIDRIYDFGYTTKYRSSVRMLQLSGAQNLPSAHSVSGVNVSGAKLTPENTAHRLHTDKLVVRGTLSSESVISSLKRAGVNNAVFHKVMKVLGKRGINLNTDFKKNGKFVILYERKMQKLLYIAMEMKSPHNMLELYRFEHQGSVKFYDKNGISATRWTLLHSPLHKAKVSSSFGMRMHPILHYTRMHKGIDFTAKYGAPIFATGNGKVDSISHDYQYGKFIKIKHDKEYSTLYAHMSHFAKGIKSGSKVKQGQIIGFVGTTGLTNGAHVHYELRKNGTPINPIHYRPNFVAYTTVLKLSEFKSQVAMMKNTVRNISNRETYFFAENNNKNKKNFLPSPTQY